MPINPTTLKALIDTQITNETVDFAITPAEVGGRMKDTIDYTSEQIALKENSSNKQTDLTSSSTNFPTVNAVNSGLALKENLANKSTNLTTDGESNTKYPSVKSVKDYADSLVVGLLDDRGNYDASTNLFPATGGSGVAGAILKGDLWFISVAGILGGVLVPIGASVRALVDTPGQTSTNWNILNIGLGFTPENILNKSIDVTIDASSDTKYPSVKAVKDYVDENAGGNLPYSIISFFLSISEATPTFVIKQNDFPDSVLSMTIPSNGKVRIITTENIFNSSTKLMATIFNVGGQMYFGVPNYNLLAFPTWFLDIDLKKFDNTQTGTPTINNIYFEIRIFSE